MIYVECTWQNVKDSFFKNLSVFRKKPGRNSIVSYKTILNVYCFTIYHFLRGYKISTEASF